MSQPDTLFDRLITWAKNHKIVVGILILAVVVIGAGDVVEAIGKLQRALSHERATQGSASQDQALQDPDITQATGGRLEPGRQSSTSIDELANSQLDVNCLPEGKVAEVVQQLEPLAFVEEGKIFSQLYEGRRVCPPGWEGTVRDLPREVSLNSWIVMLSEVETNTSIGLLLDSEAAYLRPGMRLRFTGTVSSYIVDTIMLAEVSFVAATNNHQGEEQKFGDFTWGDSMPRGTGPLPISGDLLLDPAAREYEQRCQKTGGLTRYYVFDDGQIRLDCHLGSRRDIPPKMLQQPPEPPT